MIKKISIGIICCIVVLLIGIYLFETLQKPSFSNSLSSRSQEFIQKKEASGSSQFSGLLIKEGEKTTGKRFSVGGCFSFVMPYNVFNMREEGECDYYFAFEKPNGKITAFARTGSHLSFDNLEGVGMRRQDTEKYKEEELETGGKKFLIFQNLEEPYQKTAYYYSDTMYIVITLTTSTSDSQDVKLQEILESLTTLKAPENVEQ